MILFQTVILGEKLQEFKKVRNQLIDMLEELDDRLNKITDDVKHPEAPLSKDFAEQATELENNEVLDAIGNSTRAELTEVRQAIDRIDKGSYGICVACGQPIREKRLDALPFVALCMNCASKSD